MNDAYAALPKCSECGVQGAEVRDGTRLVSLHDIKCSKSPPHASGAQQRELDAALATIKAQAQFIESCLAEINEMSDAYGGHRRMLFARIAELEARCQVAIPPPLPGYAPRNATQTVAPQGSL